MDEETKQKPRSRGNPRVFARVPPDIYSGITAMRAEYPTPDGKPAKITDIVLASLVDAAPLLDRSLRDRLRRKCRRHLLASPLIDELSRDNQLRSQSRHASG